MSFAYKFGLFSTVIASSISVCAMADNGPTVFAFEQLVGNAYISSVTAQNSTLRRATTCAQFNNSTCVQWNYEDVKALFLKLNAVTPNCLTPNTHLAGQIEANFSTATGLYLSMRWELNAGNQNKTINEWRNIEGYFGDLATAKVAVSVQAVCEND